MMMHSHFRKYELNSNQTETPGLFPFGINPYEQPSEDTKTQRPRTGFIGNHTTAKGYGPIGIE